MPRLVEVRFVRGFVLFVRFSNGSQGEIDLSNELDGEIFEPLRDAAYFQRGLLSPELRTVVWPNGADFAPEFLYERVSEAAA